MSEIKAANTLKDLPAQLDQEGWYVGLLPETQSEELLKQKGDFVVRLSETKKGNNFKLVVKTGKKLYHLPINIENNLWLLASKKKNQFKTITELIEFFKKNDLPVDDEMGVRLVNPVQKPRFLLKRKDIKFDKKLLGSGNFCDIHKGLYREKRVCAVKICHTINTADEAPIQVGEANNMIAEAKLMRSINHPNIVKFYGICCDQTPVMIVMELCPGGSLLRHLTREGAAITTGERIKFAAETAGGMNHLHSKDVVHRDLAARNCLISKTGVVKIGDFGLSKIVSDLAGENLKNMPIPLRWMAPETLTDKPQFSKASDVWAYGVLLFEIFSHGQKPWPDWENKRIATHIRRNQMIDFPSTAPDEVRKMVNEGLWHRDPTKRLDFHNITRLFIQISIKYPAPVLDKLTVNNIPDVCATGNEEPAFLCETAEDTADGAPPITTNIEYDVKLKRFVESPTPTDDQHSNKKKLQRKSSLKKRNQVTVTCEVTEEKVTQGSEEEKVKSTPAPKGRIGKGKHRKSMANTPPVKRMSNKS